MADKEVKHTNREKLLYRETLEPVERARYEEKLKILGGADPYEMKKLSTDVKLLPAVTYPDIVNYLVFTPSPYTLDDLKCFKGLDAYNQFVCGWVSGLCSFVLDGKHLVKAKVLHSQRMREKALQPWVVVESDGKILASHCTCMAGVGETCTHVASVLFAIEGTVKIRDTRTVTQEPAYWLLPSAVKNVSYSEIRDIDFSAAKTMKKKFDQKCAQTVQEGDTLQKKKKRHIPEPTAEELNQFYSKLSSTGRKPALLSVIKDFSDGYVPQTIAKKFPKILTELKDKSAIVMNYKQLVDKCSDVVIEISDEEIVNVEKATRSQSSDKMWFNFRSGRVTASNMKAVCSTDCANPSQSLVKKICYPNTSFHTEATQWGVKNEAKARSKFFEAFCVSHENAVVEESGLFISPDKPFIAASPDGIVSCDCCGKSCLEVKCPHSKKDQIVDDSLDYLQMKEDGTLSLTKSHPYYFQIQTQLGATKLESCYFVVWTGIDTFVEQIFFDEECWLQMCDKAESFFYTAVLPELVGKFYTRLPGVGLPAVPVLKPKPQANDGNTDEDVEQRWCYCDQVESGKMVCCDNENCRIVWFHFTCLKMTNEPKRKTWYCPDCRKLPQFSRKRQKLGN